MNNFFKALVIVSLIISIANTFAISNTQKTLSEKNKTTIEERYAAYKETKKLPSS